MLIESVHGLKATSITLNDRFTMLASTASQRVIRQRRTNIGGFLNNNINYNIEDLIELIARKLQQRTRTQSIRQRLNKGNPLRRYGSENNLSLRRFNSTSNLSQRLGFRNRGPWQQSNNNLRRSMSFGNLSQGSWQGRGFRRRGGRPPGLRSLLRGGLQIQFKQTLGHTGNKTQAQMQNVRRRTRGRGRGGTVRNQANKKTLPTKEELDAQLDQYMSSTKAVLDKELDSYMKNVMDVE